jgi:orotidine-5'-phosphate decarboxylase
LNSHWFSASAIKNLKNHSIYFATVHGNDAIMKAAVSSKNHIKILGVTVLTSLDDSDLKELGYGFSIEELVLHRARRALDIGCDGVVASGLEAGMLRKELGQQFIIAAPGVRPEVGREDDQKRVITIEKAFINGVNHVIMGRPILLASNPIAKVKEMQSQIMGTLNKLKNKN